MVHKQDYFIYSQKNFTRIENVINQNPEVKLSVAELLKSLGNSAFKEKDIDRAIDYYLNGIAIYRYFCPVKKVFIEESNSSFESPHDFKEAKSLLNILFLNITACYLSLKEYSKALIAVEDSLKIDGKNAKAWFRKAKALEGTAEISNLQVAIDCMELAIKYSKIPNDASYFQRILQELNNRYVSIRQNQQAPVKGKGHGEVYGLSKEKDLQATTSLNSKTKESQIADQKGADLFHAFHPSK